MEQRPTTPTMRSRSWWPVAVAGLVTVVVGFLIGQDLERQARIPGPWSLAPVALLAFRAIAGLVALIGLLATLARRRWGDVVLVVGLGLFVGSFLGQALT